MRMLLKHRVRCEVAGMAMAKGSGVAQQAEEDSADGHCGDHGGQVRASHSKTCKPLEKSELREDQEVDITDRDKADALPS